MESIENLIAALRKFPGIGTKSAKRIAFFLAKQDEEYLNQIGLLISSLRKGLCTCSECGNISEKDPCFVCRDPLRDKKTLCVVEDIESLYAFENAGIYNGIYHVLGTKSPSLEGSDLSDEDVNFFLEHVKALKSEEIIMAMNPRIESDMNYYTLLEVLKNNEKKLNVKKISRLASGIPVGGSVEFADKVTLSHALTSRMQVSLDE